MVLQARADLQEQVQQEQQVRQDPVDQVGLLALALAVRAARAVPVAPLGQVVLVMLVALLDHLVQLAAVHQGLVAQADQLVVEAHQDQAALKVLRVRQERLVPLGRADHLVPLVRQVPLAQQGHRVLQARVGQVALAVSATLLVLRDRVVL